jgi:cyclase
MYRTMIVARMKPDSASSIAEIFADSDSGELPGLVGVRGRSLFQFCGDLYLHLVEADTPPGPTVESLRDHPEFRAISKRLSAHVSAYDPENWKTPSDAMATEFYRWERPGTP